MSYAIRNTLILAAFWALVLAGGFYYVYGYQKKVQDKLATENRLKEQRLQDLTSLEHDRSELQVHLQRLQDISLGRMGTLSAHESPGETYDYILRELNRSNSRLVVSFDFKTEDLYLSLTRRAYKVAGSGPFLDFYKLLWFLESGPVFYDVRGLEVQPQLSMTGRGRAEDVSFDIEFNGFERKEGPDITKISSTKGEAPKIVNLINGRPQRLRLENTSQVAQNPAPVQEVSIPVTPPRRNIENLPEIDQRTQIMAVMPGTAVLKDHTGKTFRLKVGDRVFGGTVSLINTANGTVHFSMQQGTGSSTYILPNRNN